MGASSFDQHPMRANLLGELHARPTRPLEAPARILHFAFLTDPARAEADRLELEKICIARGLPGPDPRSRQFRVELAGATLTWERHGEFLTHSWSFSPADPDPFAVTSAELMRRIQMLPQPGPLLVAADLHLLSGDVELLSLGEIFGPMQIGASQVNDKRALIASDFAPDTFGFVRILVVNRTRSAMGAGGLAQRLLEIETYRTLALLGLPEAQRLAPSIRRIELELPRALQAMNGSTGVAQNRQLLDDLTALAAELEVGATESLYRFGATRAYDDLVRERLEALGESALPDYPTWTSFLTRRLQPAMRTCRNTEARQADLSRKLSRAAQLLRTRVDTEVEAQNGDLLRQMGERVQLQLRLQQTVEGLSIAAITYYIASVIHHLLEGAEEAGLHVEPNLDTAILIPFIVAFVAWTVWRIRRKHADE